MNKIYKILWNHAAQNWVVTSELARGNVKSSTSQLTNQLTDQPTSQLKKSFTIATLSAVIIASLFSTSAMADAMNRNSWDSADASTVVIGEQNDASGPDGGASARTYGSTTDGRITNVHHSIAIGGKATVTNTQNALAIGYNAKINSKTKGSVALGAHSQVSNVNTDQTSQSINIGGKNYDFAGKADTNTSVLSIGSGGPVRDWNGRTNDGRGHSIDTYDRGTNRYNVRQIQNVAAGRVAVNSTDGINGSQLYAVVQAVNDLSKNTAYGWKVTSEGGTGSGEQSVNNGETVTFAAGKNMTITQAGKKFTYATADDVTFNKVTVGGNEFNTNGLTIASGPSMTKTGINAGNKTITNVANGVNNNDAVNVSQLNAAKSNVAAGTNVANVTTTTNADQSKTYTVNAIGTNVTSNSNLITATKTATANNTNNQTNTYTIGLKTKNVTANKDSGKYDEIPATEGDGVVTAKALLEALKKAGWKLQANGVGNTIIKAGDVVNFVNGTGTTASVTSSNQGNKITFNINTSNLTVSKAGTTTGTISADNAGNHFATATSVANAINGAFWKAKGAGNGTGHTEQPIHAGDLVTFKGGNGIKVDQNAGTFTFSLDEDYIKKHPGLKGPKGDKGDKGDKGATGAQGAQGPRGLQGERGPQGEKGETGAPGRDGITPTVKTQDNNDGTHIVTITTGDKSSTFTVKDGAKGEKGDKGDQGVAGAKGDKGDKGDQGVAGAKGDKGDKGDQGVAGAKGDKGDKGDQGVAGAKGDKGDKGDQGVAGAKGDKGDKGDQGVAGAAGRDGKNATATVVDNHDGTHTFTVTNPDGSETHTTINNGAKGETGAAGKDGKNAIAKVETNGNTHTITITDGNGKTTTATVSNGKKGEDGKNAVASVTNNNDGTHTIKITDGNNKSTTTIVKDGKDGKNGTGGSGSNSDDGLKFTGNNEVVNNNKLNSKVIIKGEGVSKVKSETFKSAKGNINVKADGNATLEMQLAKDIDLGNDGSVTTGNTVINNNGITINNAAPNKTVSVTENGLNNGGNRIINVAPGIKGTDAVNVNQLRGAVNNIHNDMNKMDKRLSAGIAGAMSSANLYQATSSGKSMLSAGAGTYRGESAVAVGYSRLSDNGKFGVRFSANTNSRGDAGAAASVGYQW